jgi:SAM-dependent methyltransferase
MSKKFFENHTLERVWIDVLHEIVSSGQMVNDDERFLELQNIQISYSNPFELKATCYERFFGMDFIEYIHRVYSTGGDSKTGRNYHKTIYKNNGVNQVKKVIQKLRFDPFTRSATIVLADARSEKMPCVTEINFSIREKQVHMTALFKSSDIGKKFTPDMIELSHIHKEICQELGIGRGKVTAQILCAQLYISDKSKVLRLLKEARAAGYFKTEHVIENWDKEAALWDKNVKNPHHYVNFENGYSRFIDLLSKSINSEGSRKCKNALDSGCGTGIIAEHLNRKGYQVYAIDISPEMLHHAHTTSKKIKYIRGNSLDLPFADESFTLICSRGVLISHVGKQYAELFLEEHKRVLKKGGLFMFDYITHFHSSETKKRKNKASFNFLRIKDILDEQGFAILERSGDDTNRVNIILCKKV